MSTEFRFVCAMLATWRLTHLFTSEDGPADVVIHLRARMGDSFAGRAMDCFYCLSLWIAAPLALFVVTEPLMWFFAWLALSGGACLLDRATNRDAATTPIAQRARRVGDAHELLWTETPGAPIDDRAPRTADARIAGTIGIDPPWIPR